MKKNFSLCLLLAFGTIVLSASAQTEFISVEFNENDQAGFDLWPSAFSGSVSVANFSTPLTTSGTTTVTITASTTLGQVLNRGNIVDGTPPGFTYANLYRDLLIASSPTGFLTLDFTGLNANQTYQFTLFAWDPEDSSNRDRVWAVTGGTGIPASRTVNWINPLVDNNTFAPKFDITTDGNGAFQVTNTDGLPQSAINGFKLATADPSLPPTITSQPQAVWNGGEEIVIEVGVSGAEPLTYQWYLDGQVIAGGTSESLTLLAAQWDQAGDYTVRVTNANGFVDSDPADITIDIPVFPTREVLTYEPIGPSSRRTGITISEVLYHPAQRLDGRELEFIELYNSQPWAEDVSGWRLSGDISLSFPNGTSVPALGYLVAARVPADVEAEFGITGVVGPWLNNLSNNGGRVRLRKPSDAIVQELNYNDRAPWPTAADGAGHSLVLARPSYGTDDVRAWAASHSIGGSPGTADPLPEAELDHVFVSEVLSNSEPPLEDYIELRNASRASVNVSGCTLSDARDSLALYTIPAATSIPANGTRRFLESELGFALGSTGDAVYLTNSSGTRVLDAIQLPAAATDVPFVRRRSDAPLVPMAPPEIVINEIMFHPPTHDDADEWIEIYNTSGAAVNMSGWAFTNGVDFTFPNGTQIAAGGFLVIAKDRAKTLTNHPSLSSAIMLGDYSGNLSDGGERLELSRLDGAVLIPEDTVSYTDADRWHRFADGRGATLERQDPGGDSRGASNWVDSDESAKSTWTTIEATGTLAHGNTAAAAAANQVQMFLLGAGDALVDQVEVIPEGSSNVLTNGGFESGASGWFFQGNHRRSVVESGDAFEGSSALHLNATRRGDPGPNRARAPLTQTLASGSRATLRARVRWLAGHPEFLMKFKGNWLEAASRLNVPANLGTPGAVNSRAVSNAGPHIDLVTHRPVLPETGEDFRVFAQVADADGVGAVTLRYRLDPSSTTTDITMLDDGRGADYSPNDGIYTAMIPGQANGALVAFQILAENTNSASSVFPPEGECLARLGDPAGGPSFASYRVWITQASVNEWDAQPFRSNDPFSITFVYNDTRPIYGAGAFYGGNKDSHGNPLTGSVSYDVTLPENEEILGSDKLTLDYPVRDVTNQREQLMHWFADQLRLPTLHRRDIYLYMNGSRRLTIYHDAEQPDGVLANSHFPGDKGELFKTSNDNETTDAGTRIQPFVRNIIDVFEADGEIRAGRYRWTTGARSRGSRTRLDDTTIIDLMQRADDTGPDYEQRLLQIIDMENWMRTWALIDLASFWDAFGNTNWKNSYIYKPDGGKWVQFTWDFDVGLGVVGDPPTQALFPSGFDANVERMYDSPTFIRHYWRAMEESLGSFFSGTGVTPILEAKRAAYDAAGLNFTSPFSPSGAYNLSVTNWIDQRAAFILPQLNAVNSTFDVTAPLDGSSTDQQTITISGTAPFSVASIEVNAIPLELNWTTEIAWNAPFVLQPGANVLNVRALGTDGAEIATETLIVTYTGAGGWPNIAINEWMASNQSTIADPADDDFEDWIELYNPTASAVNLSGWFLSDNPADPFKFTIPAGFSIPSNSFLLIWADEEITQNNPDLHAAFKLSASGESILLTAPDGTLIDQVDFAQQSPDKTMGRSASGEIITLATPSPSSTNGAVATYPKASFTSDGTTITFTVIAEPGFLYAAESSDDLINWTPLGGSVLATGNTVEFTASIVESRRYYRFQRTP